MATLPYTRLHNAQGLTDYAQLPRSPKVQSAFRCKPCLTMGDTMWMVRASIGGALFNDFKARSVVAIGWAALGDPTSLLTRDQFKAAIGIALPTSSQGYRVSAASQLYRFVWEMQINDRIVTYDAVNRLYLLGHITSNYRFSLAVFPDHPNIRDVSWVGDVARDSLSVKTRHSLGSIQTLFMVPDSGARELTRLLSAKR